MGKFIRAGFSLIELFALVMIIAALVGVATPFFQDNLSSNPEYMAHQAKDNIKTALENYNLEHGTLVEPKGGVTKIDKGTLLALKQQGYLQSVPNDAVLAEIRKFDAEENNQNSFIESSGLRLRMEKMKSLITSAGEAAHEKRPI